MTAHSKLYIRLIAVNLSRQLGLPCPDDEKIRELYNSDIPQPIVIHNINGTVWLDPYYAAFCLTGGRITYVYISKKHIFEELKSCRPSGKRRNRRMILPYGIREQFRRALKYMRETGSDAWVETRDYSLFASERSNAYDRHENHSA